MDAREIKEKATQLFAKGKFAKAAEAFEEFCKKDSKDIQARLRMGDAWAKAGKKDKAITAYQWAAEGFAKEGFLPRAIAAGKLVLELDPSHGGIQQMLADLYAKRGTKPGGAARPPLAPATRVESGAPPPPPAAETSSVRSAVKVEAPPAPPAPPEEISVEEEAPPVVVDAAAETVAIEEESGSSAEGLSDAVSIEVEPASSSGSSVEIEIEGPGASAPAAPVEVSPPSFDVSLESAPPPPRVEAAPPPPPAVAMAAPPGLQTKSAPEVSRESSPALAVYVSSPSDVMSGPTDLERSLEAFAESGVPPLDASVMAAVASGPAPSASFTELDMDSDSLLHAVEAAAQLSPAFQSSNSVQISIEEAMDPVEEPRVDQLPKIPLFSDLPEDAFIALFNECPLRRLVEGELAIRQGEQGDSFFVICAGKARVFRVEGEARVEIATLEEGTFFGEMALLSDAPRSASVEAVGEDTQLLEISAKTLQGLSSKFPTVATALKKFCRQRLLTNLMNTAPLFKPFTKSERRDLIQKFRAREAQRGETLLKEGDKTDGLYVVLTGEVEIFVKNHRVATLREGDLFGEMSLLTRSPASATVKPLKKTSLLRLPREDFERLIMSHPQILEMVAELSDARTKQNAALLTPPKVSSRIAMI